MRRGPLIAAVGLIGVATAAGTYWLRRDTLPVRYCEGFVLELMRSPSTYRRIDAQEHQTGEIAVLLTFDAANAYNAMVRGNARCVFEIVQDPLGYPYVREIVVEGRRLSPNDRVIYETLARARAEGKRN